MSKVKGIFLDRDGIINNDTGYVYKKEDFIFKKNIFSVLKYLQKKNFLLFAPRPAKMRFCIKKGAAGIIRINIINSKSFLMK